ncbi:hypothetical protein F5880DRAFT_1618748 [Lentinula raphanica]|nr:hypothetical protein F5880DRAFT_1618748 [Lentinula raphanica]
MSTSDTGTVVDTHYLQYDVTWASIGNHPFGFKDLLHALNINFTALLYYDWALTFPDEVEYIWKAGITFPTILYAFCRYALLANVIFSVTCDDWKKFVSALSVFGRAAIIVTLIARTYAVCSQSRWILVYLLALGIVCVVADAVHVPTDKCVDLEDPSMCVAVLF